VPLGPQRTEALVARVRGLTGQGLRVLAVAEGAAAGDVTLKAQHDHDFTLLGLVAFEDPLRAPALPRPWRRPARPASRWR
jgi:Ca2+-transporting ATPase